MSHFRNAPNVGWDIRAHRQPTQYDNLTSYQEEEQSMGKISPHDPFYSTHEQVCSPHGHIDGSVLGFEGMARSVRSAQTANAAPNVLTCRPELASGTLPSVSSGEHGARISRYGLSSRKGRTNVRMPRLPYSSTLLSQDEDRDSEVIVDNFDLPGGSSSCRALSDSSDDDSESRRRREHRSSLEYKDALKQIADLMTDIDLSDDLLAELQHRFNLNST